MKQDWSCGKKTKYLVFNFLYTHWDCGCWVHSLKIAISGGVALGWTISKATVRAVTLWRPPRWLFWMWLVTVRVNTDCLMECMIAAFCLNKCNAPFHLEKQSDLAERALAFQDTSPVNPSSCVRFCGEHKSVLSWFFFLFLFSFRGAPWKQPQTTEPAPQSSSLWFILYTQPTRGNKHAVILLGCLQIFSHLRYELSKRTSSNYRDCSSIFIRGKSSGQLLSLNISL